MNGKRALVVLVMGLLWGVLCVLGAQPAGASLVVNGSDPVLMVDGGDKGSDVILKIRMTGLGDGYEFGFVEGGVFTPIPLSTTGRASYLFAGGSSVNFALRYDPTGAIYTIADPANYATEIYFGPVGFPHSARRSATATYYRNLTLDWNLNGNGLEALGLHGLTVTLTALGRYDAMAAEVEPVPLPASIALFATGLVGVVAWRRIIA
jgi:hypothetical protein